ncbi:unnamed protein product [Ambrosiozyma monospora]|uniref:Unnamed protein product n=1 Tax=Ambrosiozyma monospora TaxID=43982 RepID=A0ACB5T3U2_AMBMO|nr:unnamed protein product [Ambrosiozyma monospora]
MNHTYNISPIHVKFPVEFTFKADQIEFTKTFDNITLSTTGKELFQLCKEDGYTIYTLLIENEYYYIPSSSNSVADSPLYELMSLGPDVSFDRVPTILAVTVFCSEQDDEGLNKYFEQPLQGTSVDLAHDTTDSQINENQRAFNRITEKNLESEKAKESRRSGRFLSKVVLSDGSSKSITGHSYDRLEDSQLYVDQLTTCSVKYVVEGIDKNGVKRKIELSSQQCIIVDTDPVYEPYVMLSNSARTALSQLHKLSFVVVLVDSPEEIRRRQQHQQQNGNGQIEVNFVALAKRIIDFTVHSVVHFLTQGTLRRLVSLSVALFKYFLIFILFGAQIDYGSDIVRLVVYSAYLLYVFTRPSVLDCLQAIVEDDFTEALQSIPIQIINYLSNVSSHYSELIRRASDTIVNVGIGNNRPNLIIPDENLNGNIGSEDTERENEVHTRDTLTFLLNTTDSDTVRDISEDISFQAEDDEIEQKQLDQNVLIKHILSVLTVVFQDVLIFFVTFIPSCFLRYSEELTRREGVFLERQRQREEQMADDEDDGQQGHDHEP